MGGKQKRGRFISDVAPEFVARRKEIIDARKNKDGKSALAAYKNLVDAGQDVNAELSTIIFSTLNDSDTVDPSNLDDVLELYKRTKSRSEKPTEAFFTTAAKVLLRLNAFDAALNVVKEMKEIGHTPRHRTLSPLLAKACEYPEKLRLARSIYKEMLELQAGDLVFEDDISVILEACATSTSSSSSSSSKSSSPDELTQSEKIDWVEETLQDCARRATEPPSERLINAAKVFFNSKDAVPRPLDKENRCQCCGAAMKSMEPSDEQLALVLKQTEALAPTQNASKNTDWEKFLGWEERNVHKYDTVVDGANISYFRASSTSDSEPRYEQADVVMEKLKEMDRKPLLFFHARHISRNANRGIPKHLETKWRNNNCLFVVPHGHNDDIFWLHMSLKMGTKNWMVTNDQMRDHRFEMIQSTCAFARWKERHQTAYDVLWVDQEKKLVALLFPPLKYSVQIQCSDAGKWHFPLQVPLTERGQKEVEEKQRLKQMNPSELRELLDNKKINFDRYREVRRETLGCELPKTFGKQFEWLCF